MIRLGVNLDHVATLRQLRGGTTPYPDLLHFVDESVRAGADQITIHLREDRRHIQDKDLTKVRRHLNLKQKRGRQFARKKHVLLNLEMAVRPEMVKIALREKPDWVCLVPEKRQELTTEGGLDVSAIQKKLNQIVPRFHKKGIRVSLFIAPSLQTVRIAAEVGADAVEFHTGHWTLVKGTAKTAEWKRLVAAAKLADQLGLSVHAGHGLDTVHTKTILKLPYLQEVNIGHFLVCDALHKGLFTAIRSMKGLLNKAGK